MRLRYGLSDRGKEDLTTCSPETGRPISGEHVV